ncbi:MAG: ribonuclease R [Phaeovulum sp.]|uniref:ribonuclease R n=1 Tax=Phaeovulum sp. TaxID=2934796 RepID=UPI0027375ACF|nr:ribonuclease R [Phaeovulum sp.]MDP3860974.1 ribonuclease R [Phaeovulum sp.]
MTQIPSKTQILDWLASNPGASAKRDIAKAFGLKGAERIALKRLLKELEATGDHARRPVAAPLAADKFPPVTVLAMLPPDADGDQFAEPLEWQGATPAPRVLFVSAKGDAPLATGDRFLARMTEVAGEDYAWEARLIRRFGEAAHRVVGVFRKGAEGSRITPIDKGADREWRVAAGATLGAREGELVEAELTGPRGRMGLPAARIIARLGDPSAPRAVSLIAIHQHGIPDDFPDDVIAEADAANLVPEDYGDDLRALPFVTIDPSDARDHDDACFSEADDDAANEGGHILWVAIADVAHYVRPGTALDREARKRGNSSYFPDRVVPMLPDRLSGDLCSLHEGVPRPVLVVRMKLDSAGNKLTHRFLRGMIKSVASLSYEEVQEAEDGRPSLRCAPLMAPVIAPLYAAWRALDRARAARQPLDLDLPERKIELGEDGKVKSVGYKARLDAHKLIEEFMVLANVAAAEELEHLRRPLLYRVHEEPSPEKLDALREVAQASGFTLAKGQVLKTAHLNRLLAQAEGSEFDELLNITTLRSMQQAYYLPQNLGHFGLALRSYAHFTSPIRRYSDLIVHRALISGHGWGADGLSPGDIETLEETAQHVSETERRSMAAERDTTDRYLAAYLSDRVGSSFSGRISGVQRFGAFVKLDETGADGLIPIREIGREYFHYDREAQTLRGADTGLTLGVGQRVMVRLAEAVPVTGGLMLVLLEVEGRALPQSGGNRRAKPGGRKLAASKARERGIARKERHSRK